jgi:hypothetical protein
MKQTPHQEGFANIYRATANVLLTQLRIVILERQTWQTVLYRRFWGHLEHFTLLFRGGGPKLIGANGTSIPTWGFQKKTLVFGDKTFTHDFLRA